MKSETLKRLEFLSNTPFSLVSQKHTVGIYFIAPTQSGHVHLISCQSTSDGAIPELPHPSSIDSSVINVR